MNFPDQESVTHWIKIANDSIIESKMLFDNGFYAKNNIPHQSLYTGISGDYADLGRALFLNKSPITEVRQAFTEAANHMLKNFKMAYDKNDPDYQTKNISWENVSETRAIEGLHYALIASNFDLAKQLAQIYQDTLDGYKMDIDVNRYVHALSAFLKGKRTDAWGLLQQQFKDYEKKPPTTSGDKNYHSLITALFGIIDKNETQFNDGLALQLKLYESEATGELKDTDEEFICDDAVALANLGLFHGLELKINHDTLPVGLMNYQ